MDFSMDLSAFYADFSDAVSGPSGAFVGLIETADADAFETSRIGTHTLRYFNATPLSSGDLLTVAAGINAGTYKVANLPRRINASEFQAELVKQ